MQVNLNPRSPEAQDVGQAAQTAARASAAAGSGTSVAEDKAQLSSDQARVQSLAAQVNNAPEIRQEKVEALRRVIREGSYQVTPEQTAEAMLSDMQVRQAA
ncbi:MAG TPA: flagellar biosynthesis anti-sigma factor FlgM [Terriglobales bacterium]|nr:flagellar biosynthesis anti-sigma factor FlgM [Terriglobales bacterium]